MKILMATRVIPLMFMLGLALNLPANPPSDPPSGSPDGLVFPQLLSPTNSVLMTNAEFRCYAGGKIFFKNDSGYQSFQAGDLNPGVLAALHTTAALLDAQQQKLDAANQRSQALAAAQGGPRIGRPAPGFTATDISGKTISLSDYQGKIVVLESYYKGCPFCDNHYRTGAMQEVQREMAANGVIWLLINEPPLPDQTPAQARQDWAGQKMAVTDWIIDAGSPIARKYAMKTAPQAFVIDQNGTLVYQGAMDNLAQTHPGELAGTVDPRTARNYVREAVQALLAGEKVPVPETKPYGCRLIYSGMPEANLFQPPGFLRRQ
jgi:peroxiredoxin